MWSTAEEPQSGDLPPGEGYQLIVNDTSNRHCRAALFFEVLEPDSLHIALEEVIADTCSRGVGQAVFHAGGGTPPYSYENGGPGRFISTGTEAHLIEVFGGGDILVIQDDHGCELAIPYVVPVHEPGKPIFELGRDTFLCEGEPLVLFSPFPETIWPDGSRGEVYEVSESGIITAELAYPCGILSESIGVYFEYCGEGPPVDIANALTPNGDGENDQWYIEGIEDYPENVVRVYNRWGLMVYEKAGYENDWSGDNLPAGTYYYTLDLQGSGRYKGWVVVLK